jgi:NAD(P)-dependent dehydrogenase (short-subunit alcohol dehydrogenase family)
MQLNGKIAVVYGAAGAVGSSVARALAREGAHVYLSGRTPGKVEAVAREIRAGGGAAEAAVVDVLDEAAVEAHLDQVMGRSGRLDVSFNGMGIPQPGIQGIPLVDLPLESFALPISSYTRGHFLTARAAARRMVERQSGVILMHTPEPARLGVPLMGGMSPAWAAMEALARDLSSEVAAQGVRVVCVRTTGLPETATIDVVFGLHAGAIGIEPAQFRAMVEGLTHRRRSTTLAELTAAVSFLASDGATALTGTVVNLTGGIVD